MTRTLLLFAALSLLAACSRTPEIPDDAMEREARSTYRSTQDEEENTDSREAATLDEQPGEELPDPVAAEMKAVGPVAIVNKEPITAAEFNDELDKITTSGQVPPHAVAQLSGDQREQFKAQIVEGMIMRKIVDQQLATQSYVIEDTEIAAKIEEMKEELAFANEMAPGQYGTLEELTAQMGMTVDQLRDSVRQSIELERLVRANKTFSDATSAEAKTYYEENTSEFEQPEQVRASHILIRVGKEEGDDAWAAAKAKIVELRARALKGEDFAALAREHSEDTSSDKGGDLGFFIRKTMVAEFEDAAFRLEDGALSEPVRTHLGWHLIKRTGHRPAGAPPFDQIETQLVRFLTAQRYQTALREFLEEIRDAAVVELKLENIT